MMNTVRILKEEIYKLFSNKMFLVYFAFLVFANIFLIWMYSQPSEYSAPASAYKMLTEDLKERNIEEQNEYIQEKFNQIDAINKIDYALSMAVYDEFHSNELLSTEYREEFEKYKYDYENKSYLTYTDNLYLEYYFIDGIKSEIETVKDYDLFLEDIQYKADTLSKISIFSQEGSYSSNNIEITAKAYENMQGVEIEYYPQKGLVTALNFYITDIVLIFMMILISFNIVRDEKENGLLSIIRSTKGGRLKTAIAKMLTLVFALLFVVVVLYISNLIFCNSLYGLGDLSRNIQSVPYLMRSTLQISVFEYLGLYFITKWAAAVITGMWILFCMLIAKQTFMGVLMSVSMPLIHFIIRSIIPATHQLNVIKYANIISLLQTNEILGGYRNLHWFNNMPIQLNLVETVAGIIYFSIFAFLFLKTFSKAQLLHIHKPKKALFKIFKSKKFKATTVVKTEWYKLLIINGGAVLLSVIILFQGYTAYNSKNYIDANEMFYAYYMQNITGEYDTESYEFLSKEAEKFQPLIQAENALRYNQISFEEYQMIQNSNYALTIEYEVFNKVISNFYYLETYPEAHLVYQTGYLKFFGFNDLNKPLEELIFTGVSLVLLLSGMYVIEKTSGMKKVVYATKKGREYTVKTKENIAIIIAVIISVLSLVPRFYQMISGYGLKGLFSPAMSLSEYNNLDSSIPIIAVILLMLFMRILSSIAMARLILYISIKSKTFIFAVMISSVILIFPSVLYYMGVETMQYISFYPLFNISATLNGFFGNLISVIYIIIAIIMVNITGEDLRDEW